MLVLDIGHEKDAVNYQEMKPPRHNANVIAYMDFTQRDIYFNYGH